MLSFLIYLFCFLVFLFSLYILSRDDFVFLRANVSLEKVFNLAFITAGVGLFFARLFYVILNFKAKFLNPLTFLLFTHFPGLSLAAGVLGALIFVLIFLKRSKLSQKRLFDFFAISFLCALPFGFLLQIFSLALLKKTIDIVPILEVLIYTILVVIIIRIFQKVKLEEGSLGFLSLASFSIISIIFNIIEEWEKTPFFTKGDNFLLIVIFLFSLTLFIKQENLLTKFKK